MRFHPGHSPAMKSPKIILATLIVLIGLLLGLLLQDGLFLNRVVSMQVLMILTPLLALLIVGVVIRRTFWRKVGDWLSYAITIVGSSVLAAIAFRVTNDSMDVWKNKAVVAYVARAVPILDEIKDQKGAYPTTIPIATLGEPPELLRKYGSYSSDGNGYRFEYIDEPDGWAGGIGFLEFNSTERRWINDR